MIPWSEDFEIGEIVSFNGAITNLYQGHDIFVPADRDGPFLLRDVRQLDGGTYLRITSILTAPIGGLLVETLDGGWRRKVYISQVTKLSPLEQLAAVMDDKDNSAP